MTDRSPDRRYDELAALYRVASLSTSQDDPAGVMQEVVSVVEASLDCERAVLLLYDDATDELYLPKPAARAELRIKLSESPLLRRVLRSRTAEVNNDAAAEGDDRHLLVERYALRQVVAAPLTAGQKEFGVLLAVNSTRGAFGDSDLRLLTIIGDRAALTIENATLVATLQRQVRELDGLQRLSTLLTSTESLERVIGESILIVSDLLACEKMAILLYDEDRGELVAHPPVIGIDDDHVEDLRIRVAEPSLGSTVFRTNTPLMSNDARTDQWVNARFRETLGIETVLVVPLASGPRPIGVIEAVNAKKGYFDADDLRFTTILGGRVASVIDAKLAREREQSLVRQLREADRTKTEFVSMLAHELRGPMTTIMGFGYTLRDQPEVMSEQKRRDVLAIIVRETERLSRMVNDLLDVSRMESGTLSYELEPGQVEEVIQGIIDIHSSLRAHHFVDAKIDDDLPKVMMDKDRISQVLLNLLTNATRYSPEGTTITIRIRRHSESELHASVTDQGIGIAPQDRERVFEKFSMLPKPAWTKKGTGLGLFITKGIIEAHGGRLWIDSEVGKGTTFNFTLQTARDASSG
ncbi:MAG: ATP-binding protein [Actinomycetota bacterium]